MHSPGILDQGNTFPKCFNIQIPPGRIHQSSILIEDLTDSAFEDHLREQVAQGRTEREVLSEYMASWIPWEEYGNKLCARIKEMADA